jgi:hypothetical protein
VTARLDAPKQYEAEPGAPASWPIVHAAIAETGLTAFGGCAVRPVDVPAAADGGWSSVVLVGNAGPAMWTRFAQERRDEPNPLDAWSRRVLAPVAASFGARDVYPSDTPYLPFQRWALQALPVHASPLGLLIHREFGLWHAFRAALLFRHQIAGLPVPDTSASPCATCDKRPCLTACPVGAFGPDGFAVAACASHLRARTAPACGDLGCQARAACPVGPSWRYGRDQLQFHMAAFASAHP